MKIPFSNMFLLAMHNNVNVFVFILSILLLINSCRSRKEQIVYQEDIKPALVNFVDSSAAAKLISSVDQDGFFEQISAIDMEIQMKKEAPYADRTKALKDYKSYLAKEVSSWKASEKEMMLDIFTEAKKLCDTISPRLFPGGIKLIKIKTNHYGKDVYYTRNDIIFIPENIFPINDSESTLAVMLHEIFHVISRQNPSLRKDIYQLIGFEKANKPVKLNAHLQKRLLTNPDGVSYQYCIKLDSFLAIPLITSKFDKFRSYNSSFFDYLQFDIYKIIDKGSHYEATTNDIGSSTLPLKNTPKFFTKIKDNTQYIIHPDEIMADNFMFALQGYSKNEYKRFSASGKTLIEDLLNVLKKF